MDILFSEVDLKIIAWRAGQTLRKTRQEIIALMDASPHFNIEKKSYGKKIGNERRASITQEGKGNARNRKQADGHADIKNNIKRDGTDEPQCKKKAESIPCSKCDV